MKSFPEGQLTVRDLMTSEVITLSAGQSVSVAEVLMKRKRVRHLPVVADEDRLVGLITHRDLLRAQPGRIVPVNEVMQSEEELRVPVSAIMQTNVWTVSSAAPAVSAAKLLNDHRFGCLPVVDAGRLVGIVTEADFLRLITDSLELGPNPGPLTMGVVMSPIPETVHATETLDEARRKMMLLRIRHLPIIDDTGAPIGMLSDRDLRVAEAIVGQGSNVTVGLIGTEDPYVVALEAEVGPVLLDLASQRIGSAMVMDGGALVGIFTSTDACRVLGERLYEPSLEPAPGA